MYVHDDRVLAISGLEALTVWFCLSLSTVQESVNQFYDIQYETEQG